jgi:hypothetical protein
METLISSNPTFTLQGVGELLNFFNNLRPDRRTKLQIAIQIFYNGEARRFLDKRDYIRREMTEGSWSQRIAILLFLKSPYGKFVRKNRFLLTAEQHTDRVNDMELIHRRINQLRLNILFGKYDNTKIQNDLMFIGREAGHSLMPWLHQVGFTPQEH